MFNAEQMLGKMLAGALDAGTSSRRHGLGASLVSQLTSGAGLMTVIGLGVGAFEILKGQDNKQAGTPTVPPPLAPTATVPPPLPPQTGHTPAQVSTPGIGQLSAAAGVGSTTPTRLDGPALALRMIQAMIAAAGADGRIDNEEEARILDKFQGQGLSLEEKQVLLQELHNPKTITELTEGIADPSTAQTMYSVAALAITIDTEAERQWLDCLARTLLISPAMQKFLEKPSQ